MFSFSSEILCCVFKLLKIKKTFGKQREFTIKIKTFRNIVWSFFKK